MWWEWLGLYALPYVVILGPAFWWMHVSGKRQDAKWATYRAEMRRLDREAGVITRGGA